VVFLACFLYLVWVSCIWSVLLLLVNLLVFCSVLLVFGLVFLYLDSLLANTTCCSALGIHLASECEWLVTCSDVVLPTVLQVEVNFFLCTRMIELGR